MVHRTCSLKPGRSHFYEAATLCKKYHSIASACGEESWGRRVVALCNIICKLSGKRQSSWCSPVFPRRRPSPSMELQLHRQAHLGTWHGSAGSDPHQTHPPRPCMALRRAGSPRRPRRPSPPRRRAPAASASSWSSWAASSTPAAAPRRRCGAPGRPCCSSCRGSGRWTRARRPRGGRGRRRAHCPALPWRTPQKT